jgi:hypothetical protein
MGEQVFTVKSEVVGQPSVVSDDLVQSERWCFTTSEISCEFMPISHTVLYDIITVKLGYHKFCAIRIPKILMRAHKLQTMAWALTSVE